MSKAARAPRPWVQVPPDFFPIADGQAVKCGNRLDRFKANRRHTWADLGIDVRNTGTAAGFADFQVLACIDCGTDRITTPKVV